MRPTYYDNFCLFRALALPLEDNKKFEGEISSFLHIFFINCEEGIPAKFQGVHTNHISKVQDILQLNVFQYKNNFIDGQLICEIACGNF